MNVPKLFSPVGVWAALGAFVVVWFCIDGLLVPPDFGQTDIYYFKDAGINFAQGLGLKMRFTYGNPTFAYRDYAHYPPLYPLLFGIYVKAVGVSAASNQVFNSLVAILTGILGFLALRPVLTSAASIRYRPWAELILGVSCIGTGYYSFAYDRPDGLATALGIAAILSAIRGATDRSALTAGALCTLTLFTSPFTGIWTSMAAFIGVLAAPGEMPRRRIRRLMYIALGGIATVAVVLGLLWLWLPGWFDGFLGVASGSNTNNETGGGYFLALLRGDVHTWWSGFPYASPGSFLPLLKLGAVAAALVCTAITDRQTLGKAGRVVWLLPLLMISPLCLVTAPYQSNYPPITAALLLAAWASIEAGKHTGGRHTAAVAILAAFAVNILLNVPFEARNLLVRSSTRDSLQRALVYLESHRGELEFPGGYSAVSPATYILWRQAGLHPLISIYSGFRLAENRKNLDVLALSYPGSGDPVKPQAAEFLPEDEYRPVFQPVVPQPAVIAGHVVSKSSQTWESAIYVRRAPHSPGG
jgi:hypothetical protein